MKTSSSIFSAILFLFVITTSLVAQQVHLGTKSPYPIGNADVTSKMFLFFLQQKSIQGYADDAFMTSPNNWLGNAKASIQYTGTAPSLIYSLIPGHEEDIIDAVNSVDIQKQFNNWYADWMKNPTRQEVCNYFRSKSLAYFWANQGQGITPTPTVYFDDLGHNVTTTHQFFITPGSPDPNQDHAVTGFDAISKNYEAAANRMVAQYPNATCWQPSRHECPIFMNGRVRLLRVQEIPSGTIFDLLNILNEEKNRPFIQITRDEVTQKQDGFDFSSFNSSAPIPTGFAAIACYDDALLGSFHSAPSGILLASDKFANIMNHDQFSGYFNATIEPDFVAAAMIKFSTVPEPFSQSKWSAAVPISISSVTTLIDPTTGWLRDTYGWDLFAVIYDALDPEVQ